VQFEASAKELAGPGSVPGPVLNFPRGTLDIKKTAAHPVSI
jgi:hypothetical protein